MYRLTYWNKRGRGEQVRLLLAELDQPWEDVYVSRQDGSFQALQAEGPSKLSFGSIPLLEDDGFSLVQGPAILGYLGRKHGMIDPSDVASCARADAITLGAEDLRIAYFGLFGPGGPDKQRAFVEGAWSQRWLPAFEGLLALNGGHGTFVGPALTWADIAVFDVLDSMRTWVAGATVEAHPGLSAFMAQVPARSRVAAYLSSDRRPSG